MRKNLITYLLEYKTILLIIVFLFIIIPSIVNWLVVTPNPFDLGFVNDDNREAWISFYGAIIGGFTTLVGVWWTMKKQEDIRREDLAIQYKPYIGNIKMFENFDGLPYIRLDFDSYDENDAFKEPPFFSLDNMENRSGFHFVLENIGRGNIENLTITEYHFIVGHVAYKIVTNHFCEQKFAEMVPGGKSAIIVSLPDKMIIKKDYLHIQEPVPIIITGYFSDEFDYYTYEFQFKVPLIFEYTLLEEKCEIEGTVIIEPHYRGSDVECHIKTKN